MIIIIFGFSGAGKSTLADLLGAAFGLRVIHPSSIVKNLLQKKDIDIARTEAGTDFWESPEGVALFKSRLNDKLPIDLIGDEILIKELEKGNVVMDSWTMPWLFLGGIKIFLKASHRVRARRVAQRSGVSIRRASNVVRLKDKGTRRMYRRVRGFDMKKDHAVFNSVIETNGLTQKQVFDRANKAIEQIKKDLGEVGWRD